MTWYLKKAVAALCAIFMMVSLGACAVEKAEKKKGGPIKGTTSAVVSIEIDSQKPIPTIDEMTITRGDRLVFIGPEKFEIEFDADFPSNNGNKKKFKSKDGVVNIKTDKEFKPKSNDGSDAESQSFSYTVTYDGTVVDPTIIIKE